jgi:formylglycine-generating enzyme required for sulfatase activity
MQNRNWMMAASAALVAMVVFAADAAMADIFGLGGNQFTLDFVPISGATNPSSGYGIVANDYRMGTYEVTNDQWNKFTASLDVPVTGADGGYGYSFHDWGTGTTTVPTNEVSWYEAAQFVNWLNTSTNHQPAYKFTGTQGTSDYTFVAWSAGDPGYDAGNPFRNKAAKYYLPTEDEWVKAAYWNGTVLQTYATKAGESLTQGNGTSGTGWNYYDFGHGYATTPSGPWAVGSGSQELNDTYDMMGNNWEWMESPYSSGDYAAGSSRGQRGGGWDDLSDSFVASFRYWEYPAGETLSIMGFRVASVPEPGSLAMTAMIAVTALLYYRRKPA